MMLAESPVQARSSEIPSVPVPWSAADSWLGLGLVLFLLMWAVLAAVIARYSSSLISGIAPYAKYLEITDATALEILYVVPVVVILAWRHASWRSLGFRKFTGRTMGIGCGLLVLTYMA